LKRSYARTVKNRRPRNRKQKNSGNKGCAKNIAKEEKNNTIAQLLAAVERLRMKQNSVPM